MDIERRKELAAAIEKLALSSAADQERFEQGRRAREQAFARSMGLSVEAMNQTAQVRRAAMLEQIRLWEERKADR